MPNLDEWDRPRRDPNDTYLAGQNSARQAALVEPARLWDQLANEIEAARASLVERWGLGSRVDYVLPTLRGEDEKWMAVAVTPLGGWIGFGPDPITALRTMVGKA